MARPGKPLRVTGFREKPRHNEARARGLQSLWAAPACDIRCPVPAGAGGDPGAEAPRRYAAAWCRLPLGVWLRQEGSPEPSPQPWWACHLPTPLLLQRRLPAAACLPASSH